MGSAFGDTTGITGLATNFVQGQRDAKSAREKQELSAYQERVEAEATAATLEARAARIEIEAGEADRMGALQRMEQTVAGRRTIASGRAGYAASGVRVDQGSAADVAADTAAWSEYERQKIEYQTGMESWGLRYDAALLRQEAGTARAVASSSGTALPSQNLLASSRLVGPKGHL